MIKGLSEYEKYRVIRPVIGGCEFDEYDMPIIRKTPMEAINWETLVTTGFRNITTRRDNSNTLAHMFKYDKELFSLWNHPLKRIPRFLTCAAVGTPDHSVFDTMNSNVIRQNIFQSRWLGRTWQNYGCNVLTTVGWAGPKTYDICFSGIERESPVIISTLGCQDRKDAFLSGFDEMKRRIAPPIIIVYGDMIDGMTGTFINFRYKDCFALNTQQLRMECVSQIFTIKGVT